MYLSLLNPWMLTGLLLVSIPIAIHLLNKAKFSREPWGAMMFLQKAVQVRSRRIRLEQLLLMLLRSLILLLLALALARPISHLGSGTWKDPTTHIVILDNSFSMQQGEGADNAFDKARETALSLVDGMRESDNMLVVLAGNTPRDLFPNASFDPRFLRDRIEGMTVGRDQVADMPKALERAFWLLERSTLPRHRIYVLSDGQAYGWGTDQEQRWTSLEATRLRKKVAPFVYTVDQPAEAELRNLSIDSVRHRSPIVDIHRPVTFLVDIHNHTDDEMSTAVELFVDGKSIARRDVSCEPGSKTLEFDHSFTALQTTASDNGTDARPAMQSAHYVEARIDDDDIVLDNSFSLALEVRHHLPVLLIEGQGGSDIWESDGGLAAMALGAAGSNDRDGLFRVTRREIHDLTDITGQEFEPYRCIVLANVPSLSRQQQFALEQFVERGGGLLVALGDKVDPDAYNRANLEGKGMLPVTLQRSVSAEKEPLTPRFPAGAALHILDVFDLSRTRLLTEVRVRKYWDCLPAEDALGAGFLGDKPFLVYRRYGEGRVAVLTSSINADWSNFPTTQDFLPLLQDLVVYLSASVQPPVNLAQGEPLLYVAPPQWQGTASATGEASADTQSCTVVRPDGRADSVEPTLAGDRWVAEWLDTRAPGIYTVKLGDADPVYYAVSLQRGEGNLALLEGEARERAGKKIVTAFTHDEKELRLRITDEVGAREWWRRLIFIVLGALCLDLLLAWRFSGCD
jgi:hypothetical protein